MSLEFISSRCAREQELVVGILTNIRSFATQNTAPAVVTVPAPLKAEALPILQKQQRVKKRDRN
jgi:hypothetical protein